MTDDVVLVCEICSWWGRKRRSAGYVKYTGDDRNWELCEEHLAEAALKREAKEGPRIAKIHEYDSYRPPPPPKLRVLEGGTDRK